MSRNLRILTIAAMALTAFAAAHASAATAAPRFTAPGAALAEHTRVFSEKDFANPSGGQTSGQTAHWVFDIRKADGTGILGLTCNEFFLTNGTAIKGPEPTEITGTFDLRNSSVNATCTFAGQAITISTGNCELVFTPNGEVHLRDDGVFSPPNRCAHGEKPVVYENPVLGCKIEIAAQTLFGVNYHNIVVGGVPAITLEHPNVGTEYNATGVGCPYGTTANGLITTNNVIFRGERNGVIVPLQWDAA